jgi:hypothetical protein
MKRFLVLCGLLLFAVASFIYWTASQGKTPLKVDVTFAGFTNDSTNTRMAVFAVTNLGSRTVWRWSGCIVEGDGFRSATFVGPSALLKAGTREVITFAAPTNLTLWRATLLCTENDWRRKLFSVTGGSKGLPDSWRPAFRCRASSAWIREQPE